MQAVILALLLPSSAACAFSRSGLPRPAGHPPLADMPHAPGVPYMDLHNDSHYPYEGYDMPSDDWVVPRAIANLSAAYNEPLCYWSQQVLPSPPTGFNPATGDCAPSPCAWTSPPAAGDVEQLLALGAQATAAAQLMADASLRPGATPSFLGAQCGSGAANVEVMCRSVDPRSPVCNATGLRQRSQWAVASNILVMTPGTLGAVQSNVTAWRSAPQLHLPAITSGLVQRGWGAGGGISFKVLPCAAVPEALVGRSFGCNEVDAGTGRLVWDEAFAFWQAYQAPGWLREGMRRGALRQ